MTRGFSPSYVVQLLEECPADHMMVIPLGSRIFIVDTANESILDVREIIFLRVTEQKLRAKNEDIMNFWYFPKTDGEIDFTSSVEVGTEEI